MSRTNQLLADIADQFDKGGPIEPVKWLIAQNMAWEDLQEMNHTAASILRGFLTLGPEARAAILAAGSRPSQGSLNV